MDNWPLGQVPSAIILAAAVLAALAMIGRSLRSGLAWCRKVARQLQAMGDIVERELEHNHGSSMKDDVHGIAVAVGLLQRRYGEQARKQRQQERQLREIRELIDHHHPTGVEEQQEGEQ